MISVSLGRTIQMIDGSGRDVMQFRVTTQHRVSRELKVPGYPNAAPSFLKDDLANISNGAVNTKSENDIAELLYTTVRKNDRRCDSNQFAIAELMFRVRWIRKVNSNRWQFESTTQVMYMGNVAMRGAFLVKIID